MVDRQRMGLWDRGTGALRHSGTHRQCKQTVRTSVASMCAYHGQPEGPTSGSSSKDTEGLFHITPKARTACLLQHRTLVSFITADWDSVAATGRFPISGKSHSEGAGCFLRTAVFRAQASSHFEIL